MAENATSMAFIEAIKARRSTRGFSVQAISPELLQTVVECGRYAPSASNAQATHFLVITNPDKLSELRAATTQALADLPISDEMPAYFKGLLRRAREGIVDVTYGAQALVLTANKKQSPNACFDCACAMENMMLAASALGLGSCWINQFFMLREVPAVHAFFESIGLGDDEDVFAALALGHSDNISNEPLPRSGNPVTNI